MSLDNPGVFIDMTHPASQRRAEELLASATPCWRKCGIAAVNADELAAALDEAWEAGRRFAAAEARKHVSPIVAAHVERQIMAARRPE